MLRALPVLIEPDQWTLAFHRTAARRWVGWLAMGRFKHVSAFAWVPEVQAWWVFDVTLSGVRLVMLPDSQDATSRLADMTADAELVTMQRRKGMRSLRLTGFYCCSAIISLVGIDSKALRPDTLFRDCLRAGGNLVGGVYADEKISTSVR